MEKNNMFNKRVWLNPDSSSSTGSVVCYSGKANWTEEGKDSPAYTRFVEIADCHNKVRIHQGQLDSLDDFINKIDKMICVLNEYSCQLRSENVK